MGSTGGSQDIAIRVTLDSAGAITGLEQLGNKAQDTGKKAEGAGQGFSKLQATIVAAQSAIGLLQQGFSALDGVFSRGGQVVDVANAFGSLSAQAGITADVFIGKLQTATDGTISKFDLMREANEALTAGLTPDQFETLAGAAKRLGDQFGGDTQQKINALSQAINRGSENQLKLAGVTIDTKQLFGEFADTMSDGEKQAKITAEAIRQLAADNAEAGGGAGNAADAFDQFKASLTNAYDDFAAYITNSEELTKVINLLGEAFKLLPGIIKFVDDSISVLAIGFGAVSETFLKGVSGIAKLRGDTQVYETAQKSLAEQTARTDAVLLKLRKSLAGVDQETTKGSPKVGELGKNIQNLGNSQGLKDFSAELNNVGSSLELAGSQFEFAFSSADSIIQSNIDGLRELGAAGRDFDLLGDASNAAVVPVKVTPTFTEALGKIDTGAILGGLLGDLGGAGSDLKITKQESSGLATSIGGALGGAVATAGVAAAGASIGAIAGSVIPVIGTVIGAVLGGVIAGAFTQEDSASVKARKAADKYFAEIFNAKRLTVIIGGQLTEIKDLVFGTGTDLFTTGAFDDALGALPEKAQQAFNGVGLAFGTLLETGRDVAQQLGAVFANNLGGDLNNLQLLIQATGASLEELQGAMVEAFLAGDASAIQTINSIQQLQELFTVGIPGAVGATDQAFQNLIDSGGRGRAAYDALIDVVAESKEKGSQSLEQLRSDLESTGKFTATQIDTLFKAFKDVGVTNFQQVLEASKETIIGILANIEAQGSLYSEQATQVQNLRTQLEAIPAESRKKIYFDVQTNFDSNTNKAINAGVFESPQLDGVK